MQTKPSPKSAYHYDSDIDYYNSQYSLWELKAMEDIENGEVDEEFIEGLVEKYWEEIVDWLYDQDMIYEPLVRYYKELWEISQEP